MHAPKAESAEIKPHAPVSHYRPDIDGLRAIAVIAVVTYHTFPSALPSGFVGVDIFFVISGFLITSIILDGLGKDGFSFSIFYARRIRRIFPALLIVLAACVVAGWFLLLPDEYRLLGQHVVAGAGSVSNLELWREAGYFDAAADTKILLHLWSLGVEEQYYLVWPAVVWMAWRFGLNLLTLVVVLFVASFAYGVEVTRSNPVLAFYSPLTRFWELCAGGFLALVTVEPPAVVTSLESKLGALVGTLIFQRGGGSDRDRDSDYRGLLSVLGLSLIVASTVSITSTHNFPGWWALMPAVGAYLTILAGPAAWLNRTVLANRVMVRLGLISYPLYLWHWPLLSFARNVSGSDASLSVRASLVLASVALAWFTYALIERPIRFGRGRRWTVLLPSGAMIVVAACGGLIFFEDGFAGRMSDKEDYVAYFSMSGARQIEEAKSIAQNQCNFFRWDSPFPSSAPRDGIDPSCYTKHSDKSVMILGDSNAADLYFGLNQVLPKDISTLLIYGSDCRFGAFSEAQIHVNRCDMANYFALNRIKQDPPDVVLIGSNNSFDIDDIRAFTLKIKGYGVNHVFLLGQRPHWNPYLYKTVLKHFWRATPQYIPRDYLDHLLLAYGDRFEAQLTSVEPFEFVSEMDPFCNAAGCLAYLGDNRRDGLITFDSVHLRPFASVWLAEKQLAPLILKHLPQQ